MLRAIVWVLRMSETHAEFQLVGLLYQSYVVFLHWESQPCALTSQKSWLSFTVFWVEHLPASVWWWCGACSVCNWFVIAGPSDVCGCVCCWAGTICWNNPMVTRSYVDKDLDNKARKSWIQARGEEFDIVAFRPSSEICSRSSIPGRPRESSLWQQQKSMSPAQTSNQESLSLWFIVWTDAGWAKHNVSPTLKNVHRNVGSCPSLNTPHTTFHCRSTSSLKCSQYAVQLILDPWKVLTFQTSSELWNPTHCQRDLILLLSWLFCLVLRVRILQQGWG